MSLGSVEYISIYWMNLETMSRCKKCVLPHLVIIQPAYTRANSDFHGNINRIIVTLNASNQYWEARTIHFHQKLIKSVFPLIMPSNMTAASTGTTNSIDFINKYNTRCILSCLSKQISDSRWTNTHKHFQEFWSRDTKKWHLGLACNCLG